MLKFLLIIILIYLVYKMFLKPILRSFISAYMTQGNQGYQNNNGNRRKGKINIDHVPDNSSEFKEGEYIDYEEVKNN